MLVSISLVVLLSIAAVLFFQFYVLGGSFESSFRKIEEAYNEKNYSLVLQYIDKLHPKHRYDARVLWIAANMYAEQEQYILAILQLQEIVSRTSFTSDITEIKVYRMLAKLLENSGNVNKALEMSEIATKLSTDDFDSIVETAALAYKNDKFNMANEYLLRALKINTTNPTVYYLLADISFKNKSYKMSRDYISKAIGIEGQKSSYCLLLGKIFLIEKNYVDAINNFLIVFEKNDEFQKETTISLANLYYETKDFENAKKYFSYFIDDEAYLNDSSIIDQRYYYAQIMLEEKNYESALEQWNIIKTLRSVYLDVDEKIKTYTTIINSSLFRTALKMNIVEYLETQLYKILTLNGYIVTSHLKKSSSLIYFTAMKKFSDNGQSYLSAFALDTSGNKVRKDTMMNFYSYMNEKQTPHAYFLSIGGFVTTTSMYDNLELVEPERFEAILEGVVSFGD